MVALTAIPQSDHSARKTLIVADFAVAVLFVVLGATLVLLRPSLLTWGFYFYCLAFSPGDWTSALVLFRPGPYVLATLIRGVGSAATEPLRAAAAPSLLLVACVLLRALLALFESTKSEMRGTISARKRVPLNTP